MSAQSHCKTRLMAHIRGTTSVPMTYGIAVRLTVDQEVGGSSPPSCTNEINHLGNVCWPTALLTWTTVSVR